MHYLVRSSSGALLMVRRIMVGPRNTLRFVVFVAGLWSPPPRWVVVNGLGGGEALFVGRLCSRAMRARDAVRSDKIFFLDDSAGMSFRTEKLRRPSYDAAVYDMTDGTSPGDMALPRRREVAEHWTIYRPYMENLEGA